MGGGQGLHGVGDQLPGGQGIVHPPMAHDDAVAYADGGHHHRRAAGGVDAGLDSVGQLAEMGVAGDDVALGGHDTDQGLLQFLIGKTGSVKQGSVGCPVRPFCHLIADHGRFPPHIHSAEKAVSLTANLWNFHKIGFSGNKTMIFFTKCKSLWRNCTNDSSVGTFFCAWRKKFQMPLAPC